jgi:hypothetical protein
MWLFLAGFILLYAFLSPDLRARFILKGNGYERQAVHGIA